MTNTALRGKSDAGNPHVRFDEGEVAPAAKPRRGSLLYNMPKQLAYITVAVALGGCAICTGRTSWNDLIPGALEDAADFEKGVWTLSDDGVLTASKDSALWFKGDYSDFALDLEYKLDPAANSGVIIYTSDVNNWIPNSVEVQLLDDYADKWKNDPPRLKNGGLYGHIGPEKSCGKPAGEWNHMTIYAQGNHVKVVVNGVVTVDDDLSRYTSAKTNPDGTPIPSWLLKPLAGLPKHGAIGLQGMHGGARPYFRNLRVRPLGK